MGSERVMVWECKDDGASINMCTGRRLNALKGVAAQQKNKKEM